MVEKVIASGALRALLGLTVAILAHPSIATAHALDEYLQAVMVNVTPQAVHVQLYLTPGVAVADKVLAEIDTDHDGVISDAEAASYTTRVRHELVAKLDAAPLVFRVDGTQYPSLAELHSGLSYLKLELSASYSSLAPGKHVFSLENRHAPAPSAYLFNAMLPSSSAIKITRQERNPNQSQGRVEFTYQPPISAALPPQPSQHPWILCWLTLLIGVASLWAYRKGRARVALRRCAT